MGTGLSPLVSVELRVYNQEKRDSLGLRIKDRKEVILLMHIPLCMGSAPPVRGEMELGASIIEKSTWVCGWRGSLLGSQEICCGSQHRWGPQAQCSLS